MEPRPDRSGILGRSSSSGDLIEDIHRQQRRRVLKRAAQLAALALLLLSLGVAFKHFADERARDRALDAATTYALAGSRGDVAAAAAALDASLEQDPDHVPTLTARAVVGAVAVLEFGGDPTPARALADAVPADAPGRPVVTGLAALAEGDVATAHAQVAKVPDDLEGLEAHYGAYLEGWLAVATARADPEGVERAVERVGAELETTPTHVALRRMLARLLVYAGRADEALPELERARDLARAHAGLAADEALYNAHLRQEPGGVASVADQLLASGDPSLGPLDLAHARLARAVVHVHSGELDLGLQRLEEAWPDLAAWDGLNRRLCVVTALEAGAGERALSWAEDAGLDPQEVGIFEAWSVLLTGDVMRALELLAELPQAHPRVAYLQALALVEQGRHAEAIPWIDRADKLLPGRVELEVARARAELHTGDRALALRKLEALAKEEPYAPRAWTGLGEAHLAQDEPSLKSAEKAFQKAVDREPVPAAALRGLAHVWQARSARAPDPEDEAKAQQLLERAAEVNPALPEYEEELGMYLARLGHEAQARERLRPLADDPSTKAETLLRLVQLEIEAGNLDDKELDAWLETARERGADEAAIELERARRLVARGEKDDVAAAQAKLQARLDAAPNDTDARILYAETLWKQHDRKAAEQAIRRGLPTAPMAGRGRLLLAWAQLDTRVGRSRYAAPRARAAFNRMLAEDRPARELLDAADLACRLWIRQRHERVALTIADKLTERLSNHAEAWTIRAMTELGGGEATQAMKSAQTAIDLDPDLAAAHAALGTALLRHGQRDAARRAYEKAIAAAAGTPDEAEFRKNLARL